MTEKGPKLKNPMTKNRKLNKAVLKTGFPIIVLDYARCLSSELRITEKKTEDQERIAKLKGAAESIKDAEAGYDPD